MARPRKPPAPFQPKWAKSFTAWEKRAQRYLARTLSIGDAFDADDPYDLGESPFEAWTRGVHPHAFMQQAFAEDFASLALEDDQRRQAEHDYASEFAAEIDEADASEMDEEIDESGATEFAEEIEAAGESEPDEDAEEEPEDPEDFRGEVIGEIIDGVPNLRPEAQCCPADCGGYCAVPATEAR